MHHDSNNSVVEVHFSYSCLLLNGGTSMHAWALRASPCESQGEALSQAVTGIHPGSLGALFPSGEAGRVGSTLWM